MQRSPQDGQWERGADGRFVQIPVPRSRLKEPRKPVMSVSPFSCTARTLPWKIRIEPFSCFASCEWTQPGDSPEVAMRSILPLPVWKRKTGVS